MIVNPFRDREKLETFAGTRLIKNAFDLVGTHLQDPQEAGRWWRICGFYVQPEPRSRNGVRARVVDQKGFVSFALQADLEVMLGMYRPGQKCLWSGNTYSEPGDHDFYGMRADEDDLEDDLYCRELVLRGVLQPKFGGALHNGPQKLEIKRRVHLEHGRDCEELFVFVRDHDPDTGASPDLSLRNVCARWSRAERTMLPWAIAR